MPTVPSSTEFIKTAMTTAYQYGFRALHTYKKDKRCKDIKKAALQRGSAADRRLDALHGMLTSGICEYYEGRLNAFEEPLLAYTVGQVPRTGEVALSLHIFGVRRSIAEALLIQTVRSLLKDLGYKNHSVKINSLGDRDSVNRYTSELTNFLRKRIESLPAPARELMKDHPLVALMYLIERNHELALKSPSPLEYLSDHSRKHFREIIEYLDMSDTPYEIDSRLIGHHQCYSDALFSIDLFSDDDEPIAETPIFVRGGRYDAFVNRLARNPIPAAGVVVVLRERKIPSRMPRMPRESIPSVFVVQLGFGPKIRSLMILDELHRANISVYQNLASDSLSIQLRQAEARKVPFSVIIGQKEFVENTAIVRDMRSRSQESIPVTTLVPYLKRVVRRR